MGPSTLKRTKWINPNSKTTCTHEMKTLTSMLEGQILFQDPTPHMMSIMLKGAVSSRISNLTKTRGSFIAVTSVTGDTSRRAAARGSKFFPNDVDEAIT